MKPVLHFMHTHVQIVGLSAVSVFRTSGKGEAIITSNSQDVFFLEKCLPNTADA